MEAMPTLGSPTNCQIDSKAIVYIQYECKVPLDRLSFKQMAGNLSGCITVFSALYLLSILWYLKRSLKVRKVEHDL